jgi:hypothetical protein
MFKAYYQLPRQDFGWKVSLMPAHAKFRLCRTFIFSDVVLVTIKEGEASPAISIAIRPTEQNYKDSLVSIICFPNEQKKEDFLLEQQRQPSRLAPVCRGFEHERRIEQSQGQ